MMSVFLSVCIIVRDEEKLLERCLESVYGIADEVIVVDTGSIDKTKEIAIRFTEQVYDFEWINDFSRARNYAASKASGEWIFVIDADEYVERESFKKFKEKLHSHGNQYEILAPKIVSFLGRNASQTELNYHERIYKNNGLIEYNRPIHEILINKKGAKKVNQLDLIIYHSGYMTDVVREKDKNKRNLMLLLKNENKTAIDYFYLGNEYAALGEKEQAIDYYYQALREKGERQVEWEKNLFVNLIQSLQKVNRIQEALSIIEIGRKKYPKYVDYLYYKGLMYFEVENYEKSRVVFEEILNEKEKFEVGTSIEYLEVLPTFYLAQIYESINIQQAIEYYLRFVSLTNTNILEWARLLYLVGKDSTLSELTKFINEKVVKNRNMTESKLMIILLEVPILNIQKLSRSLLDNQNLTEIQYEALLIKNHLLDHHFTEVYMMLEDWSDEKMIEILQTKIFSIQDYLMFLMLSKYNRSIKLRKKYKAFSSIKSFLAFVIENKNVKINSNEEKLFLQIYQKAKVYGIANIAEELERKACSLSRKNRKKFKEIESEIY